MTNRKVRVRFAPSPTGPLHIGGVRTALFNYLFAKKHGGDFILRIEDTDSQRFVPGAEEYIIESFRWLGLPFDEGPHVGGNFKPYRQSERKSIYKQYVNYLLEKQLAYTAFDTPEELEAKRNEIPNFQYDASTRMGMKNSLSLSTEEIQTLMDAGTQYVIRVKIEPDQIIVVKDLIRGEITVNSSIIDDKVLYKSTDELPTYHLANIVDDHLMEITHVIRGEEWLPSTPLHVILYKYFGWEDTKPEFAHLPLLLKPEGNGKLSKRDGDRLGFPVFPLQWNDPKSKEISSGFRENGYLPEALLNFLALLGWNPGDDREIFSLSEMIDLFTLERVSKGGAKFDFRKGVWFNHQYIQMKPNAEIADLFLDELAHYEPKPVFVPYVAQPVPLFDNSIFHEIAQKAYEDPKYFDKIVKIIGLVKERVNFVKELWDQASFFFVAPTDYDEKSVQKRWKEDSAERMQELINILEPLDNFSAAYTEPVVMNWTESKGHFTGNIMNAFRVALVGEAKGPHLFDIMEIIGQEEVIGRLEKAIVELK